jgi:hypothetical protein
VQKALTSNHKLKSATRNSKISFSASPSFLLPCLSLEDPVDEVFCAIFSNLSLGFIDMTCLSTDRFHAVDSLVGSIGGRQAIFYG